MQCILQCLFERSRVSEWTRDVSLTTNVEYEARRESHSWLIEMTSRIGCDKVGLDISVERTDADSPSALGRGEWWACIPVNNHRIPWTTLFLHGFSCAHTIHQQIKSLPNWLCDSTTSPWGKPFFLFTTKLQVKYHESLSQRLLKIIFSSFFGRFCNTSNKKALIYFLYHVLYQSVYVWIFCYIICITAIWAGLHFLYV